VLADDLLNLPQYSLPQADKEAMLTDRLRELTILHRERCEPYRRILDALGRDPVAIRVPADVPLLPVGLFKTHALRSVPESEVFKIVTSSGTTGSQSRVYLDASAAQLQTRTLAGIMTHWLGPARLPMIVVDARGTIPDRRAFSARGAGIVGMSTFGRDHFFALDDHLELDRAGLADWLRRHAGLPVLIFGFTFMVWQHLVQTLRPGEVDLSQAVLIHSGGWKRMGDRSVGPEEYKRELARVTGLHRVHNFYGMAEQIGTVFVECEAGSLHAPHAADVLVRDPRTWQLVPDGEVGAAQVLSGLPESYPGHSILTEDLVRVVAIDSCPCGRLGKAVSVLGRLPAVELRGCSDTQVPASAVAA
jgi:hypothetical protein